MLRTTLDLPDEILRDVFEFAIGDDPILSLSPWHCMAESAWRQMILCWSLLEPHDRMQFEQRLYYFTKKALLLTSKKWSRVAQDFMYRAVMISDLDHVRALCGVLDRNGKLGWWTRGIYFHRGFRKGVQDYTSADMAECISSLLRHCPNIHTFMIDPAIGCSVFPVVADAARTYCAQSLTSIRWNIPYKSQGLLIPALQGLTNLVTLHIQLSSHAGLSKGPLNSAPVIRSLTDVSFPALVSLSLRDSILDIIEEIPSWDLPKLTSLTLDFGMNIHDFSDIVEIISTFGLQLEVLDINAIPTLDVARILAACPLLKTFCFNLDWHLDGGLSTHAHKNIERIGLHGLKHAFGVGYAAAAAAVNPFDAIIMRRRNDNNFLALSKNNFPKLSVVRMLSPQILRDLNKDNGPAKGVCYERWERWWEQLAAQRVRLEDCAGNLLGTLPEVDEDGDDDFDYEDDESYSAQLEQVQGNEEPSLLDLLSTTTQYNLMAFPHS